MAAYGENPMAAVSFARVKRYREDKTPAEADTLATVRRLVNAGAVSET